MRVRDDMIWLDKSTYWLEKHHAGSITCRGLFESERTGAGLIGGGLRNDTVLNHHTKFISCAGSNTCRGLL